jgi:uncharacterized membrane protein YhaH (DUF805 family)
VNPKGAGVQWYLEVLKKYTVFDGRAHRTEFWMFVLVNLIISILLGLLDNIIGTGTGVGLLQGLYGLAVIIPSLAVGARRLHDTNRSGWWQLLLLIPLVGVIVLIVFWAQEGEKATNQHGPDPWAGPQPV